MRGNRIGMAVLVAVAATGLTGCQHALWGNAMAVGLTLGMFFGTLSLGRRGTQAAQATAVEASAQSPSAPTAQ